MIKQGCKICFCCRSTQKQQPIANAARCFAKHRDALTPAAIPHGPYGSQQLSGLHAYTSAAPQLDTIHTKAEADAFTLCASNPPSHLGLVLPMLAKARLTITIVWSSSAARKHHNDVKTSQWCNGSPVGSHIIRPSLQLATDGPTNKRFQVAPHHTPYHHE